MRTKWREREKKWKLTSYSLSYLTTATLNYTILFDISNNTRILLYIKVQYTLQFIFAPFFVHLFIVIQHFWDPLVRI